MSRITDLFRQIIEEVNTKNSAEIWNAADNSIFRAQKITIDLSLAREEAKAYEILFPFKAIGFKNGTGGLTSVNVKFDKNDSGNSTIPFSNNDFLNSTRQFSKAFLSWEAQPGKTVDVIILTDSEFKSGSLINSGTVSLSVPSTISGPNNVTLVLGTAAVIAPVNLNRRSALIENNTGGDLFIGSSNTVTNTGATRGIKILNGQTFTYSNTDELYGYSVTGGQVVVLEEA